jgi:pSer/pThr/pTyr-binding forkhead associated (FHA) protein
MIQQYTTLKPLAATAPGDDVPLTITYQEDKTDVKDDTTVLIGSDAASTIRIVRPGISRKHAVVSFDGDVWKVEDAGSRNGIFADGQRIQTVIVEQPTTLFLGHPTDGEEIAFIPDTTDSAEQSIQEEIDAFVITDHTKASKPPVQSPRATAPAPAVDPTRVQPTAPAGAYDAELAALTAALRDQISSVKGLTWSVWAMIAVTATLAVMTLFVGILGT